MNNSLIDFLDCSKTAYSANDNLIAYFSSNGFNELKENEKWNIKRGGKYYISKDGSALIAFVAGEKTAFNIVASHGDSPCFKLKANPEMKADNYFKLNVERYGGGIFYSFLDRPLTVSGRVILSDGKNLESKTFTSAKTIVIPSVAIHFNRTVNDGVKLNPQTDMSPIEDIINGGGLEKELKEFANGKEIVDFDLFVVPNQKPFVNGFNDELLSSPRIDNLTSAFSSTQALVNSCPKSIAVCFVADNEEVGSGTKQGAGSTFLFNVLSRICKCFNEDLDTALANSFMVSDDNAHAVHPNHAELSDPTNRVLLGNGIVIKHHANQNYTTDAFSSSIIKKIFEKANAKYQDFFMRSDLPCGGTLGAISSSQVSIRSVDIGLPQLAMHSAVETMAISDYDDAVKGLTGYYNCLILSDGAKNIKIEF